MRFLFLIVDLFIISLSWVISCHFFLGPQSAQELFDTSKIALPIIFCIKFFFFYRLGLYRAILRYASFHFAVTTSKAVTLGSFFAFLIVNYPFNKWPLGLFVMDWLVTLFLVGFSRFAPRYYFENTRQENGAEKRVLVYGAGDLGDAVARSLLKQKSEFIPVGFIDDAPKKQQKKIHNIPVLGTRADLDKTLQKYRINEVIITIPNVAGDWLRGIFKQCRHHNVLCRIAPTFSDMMGNDVNVKNIDITDLLKRDPKDLDEKQIDRFLRHKKILITGAGGSIGSELVRQALRFRPKKLVAVDNSEFGLYKLEEELQKHPKGKKDYCKFKFVLQDICDTESLDRLLQAEKPNIVFHAAAYKHVPLLETNPFVGILNNIQGTINVAKLADRHGVEKFVLISTDKAVRPTNVMGATKRICELYIQNLNLRSNTDFVAVRFGNVLGSSGSVIPKFLEQIRNGGPVTVTHPNVTRYFMLTQEAVALVMQAASIGHGGEIFVLNMGKPVKIKDMAEDLIFLAGKAPHKDIHIQFTGLRPGEKLYEELLIDETEKQTQYENITIGRMTYMDWNKLDSTIRKILEFARQENKIQVLTAIKELVPGFNHIDLPHEEIPGKVLSLSLKPARVANDSM